MPKEIYSCDGEKLLAVIDARPHPGDLCARCGDDLYNGGEICIYGGDHVWKVRDCGELDNVKDESDGK